MLDDQKLSTLIEKLKPVAKEARTITIAAATVLGLAQEAAQLRAARKAESMGKRVEPIPDFLRGFYR